MAKDPEKYRLCQHDVKPPKKSERTVIAKVNPDATAATRTLASSLSAGGRAARAAGVTPDSGLARLLDGGHVASIKNVFDVGLVDGGSRALSMFVATGRGRTARARSPRLVELKVSRGTSPSTLAAHVARMKDVEYAFVVTLAAPAVGRRCRGAVPDSG